MDTFRRYPLSLIIILLVPYFYVFHSLLFKKTTPEIRTVYDTLQPKLENTDVGRTLVLYVWADTDIQAVGNLEFFIRYGVSESQPADFYFILQKVNKTPVNESSLPRLPSNGHYLQHENECYDFGTFGWFLGSNIVDLKIYKFFILMNASIRGPFFTSYFDSKNLWWFNIFTSRLNDVVKLVGPTINCEYEPHVQSYLLVTDHVGLSILSDNKTGVLSCKKDYNDAVMNGEIGASRLILNASYQIASLQVKYQGVDFRRKENAHCNSRISPIFFDGSVDGISHDPFELVFVKYKGIPPFDSDLERRATVYQRWLQEQEIHKRAAKAAKSV